MKIEIMRGSGVGSHPCAGAGWKVTAEGHEDAMKLARLAACYKKDYPDALSTYPLYPEDGQPVQVVDVWSCTTVHHGGTPFCGGRPEGALDIAWAVLDALAQ